MKLKTLLLGSATAILVAGGAQAADLSIAEPVDYVRVCDAFGVGYWYIPGTDTCIKFGGNVRFDASVYNDNEDYYSGGYDNHYQFVTSVYLTISTKSMTDWGPLEGFMAFYGNTGHGGVSSVQPENGIFYVDEAYVSIGPLLVGQTRTLMTYERGGFAWDGGGWFNAEHMTDQVRLSWAMNGFGLAVSLEEPRYEDYPDHYGAYSSFPDVVAALTFSNAMFDFKVSGVYSDFWNQAESDPSYAIAAGIVVKLDSLAPGDKLLLKGAYGTALPFVWSGAYEAFGISDDYGEPSWSVMASFIHYMSPDLWASITANYAAGPDEYNSPGDGITSVLQAQFAVGYQAAPNFWVKPSVTWLSFRDDDGYGDFTDWLFNLRIQRDFGDK